jgi:phospholipid/cholesterol/gamma-HCH transport system permease protein
MSAAPRGQPAATPWAVVQAVGAGVRRILAGAQGGVLYVGGVVRLVGRTAGRAAAAVAGAGRISWAALRAQMIRVGVKSIPIIILVQTFVGIILALNMAPTLELYGQLERTADIVAIAVVRELGALISAIVLSGFAGASIAAELGAMVEGEEIKALRAHALDPIRFLVAPRIFATTVMMVGLTILADVMGIVGGLLTAVWVLDISTVTYIDQTRAALTMHDYWTGLMKAGVFGLIIASLACYEGLNVRGGAEGVGRATTTTVVKSIVALIGADCVFTAIFYVIGW